MASISDSAGKSDNPSPAHVTAQQSSSFSSSSDDDGHSTSYFRNAPYPVFRRTHLVAPVTAVSVVSGECNRIMIGRGSELESRPLRGLGRRRRRRRLGGLGEKSGDGEVDAGQHEAGKEAGEEAYEREQDEDDDIGIAGRVKKRRRLAALPQTK